MRVFVMLSMCVEERGGLGEGGRGGVGCSWLFPVGEWQIGGERSVSQGGHSRDEVRSDPGQILLNKFLYSRHLLRTGAVREPWVGFEGDHLRVDYGFEFFRRHGTKLYRDHGVHLTVALQDRDVLVAARRRWETPVKW